MLYRPGDDRTHRGVILLGGSEGGFPGPEGAMLASRGFVVLALAYFGAEGLPASLQRIPIEYFGRAIDGLQALPGVERGGITLVGTSRGSEAALMAGAAYSGVNGVAAISPSNVRWEGTTARKLPGGPAWTFRGQALPYVPFHFDAGFAGRYLWGGVTGHPLPLRAMFVESLGRAGTEGAQIAVEEIHGPVLLASGGDDRTWPSGWMSDQAIGRLRRLGHRYADEQVSYEGAGHWIPWAYLPTKGLQRGTAEATARAQAEWWPRLVRFLERGEGKKKR
jgi:dienelactone hydrolase